MAGVARDGGLRLPRFWRPLRLVAVGVAATAAYAALSLGFVLLLGLAAPVASLLGHALAGFVSYFGHRHLTFRLDGAHGGAPLRFVALNAASYGAAYVTPWIATRLFGLPDTAAILVTAVVLPAINALLIARLVFKAPLLDDAPGGDGHGARR